MAENSKNPTKKTVMNSKDYFLPSICIAMALSFSCVKQGRSNGDKISIGVTDTRREYRKSLFKQVFVQPGNANC